MPSDDQVFEIKKTVLKSPIVFAGFVGAGLVGPLSVGYMIDKLKMKEIAYLRSKHLPPSTVFMQGRLRHPFRLYSNNDGTICACLLYTSPSPRDKRQSRMPSSA